MVTVTISMPKNIGIDISSEKIGLL